MSPLTWFKNRIYQRGRAAERAAITALLEKDLKDIRRLFPAVYKKMPLYVVTSSLLRRYAPERVPDE